MPTPTADYSSFVRPWAGELMAALRLDVTYARGEGDWLTCTDGSGPARVLDVLGGYGANLFGHHHPRLTGRMVELLTAGVPVQVQGSIRPLTAELARALSDRVGQGTTDYVVTFANSGAETVEAALKHAALAWRQRVGAHRRAQADRAARALDRHATVEESRLEPIRALGYTGGTATADALAFVADWNARVDTEGPRALALRGGFHGKTLGAVQLTHQDGYRRPFDLGTTLFVHDPESLETALAACRRTVVEVRAGQGGPELVTTEVTVAMALVVEPLQGEAGVHPLEPGWLQHLAATVRAEGVPLVLDEIQSGMGRTGTFCFAEQLGVRGDYVLLAKSLGGGLAKTGAMLVRRDLYVHDFGRVHSSTFAEDDLSAGVALEALRVLDDEDVLATAAGTGTWLRAELAELQQRHPGVVTEVRGAGLMVGVEFADQSESSSGVLQALSRQDLLGHVLAAYLLREHGVRVAPTLSSPRTLRLEPSFTLSREDAKLVLHALDAACEALAKADAYHLTRFLVGAEGTGDLVVDHRGPSRSDPFDPSLPQVAFAAHLVTADDIALFDPSLGAFTPDQRQVYLDRIAPHLAAQLFDRHTVVSATGAAVQLTMLGVLADSAHMSRALREDLTGIRAVLADGAQLAADAGCRTLGLGGYSSIVTRNGLSLPPRLLGVTTGNALTVGMGLRAVLQAAGERGVDLDRACFAAIGAGGNIASVHTELMSDRVPQVLLIGRPGREHALLGTAMRVYRRSLGRLSAALLAGTVEELTGVARVLAAVPLACELAGAQPPVPESDVARLHDQLAARGAAAPVRLATDLAELRHADLVLAASNAAEPIVFPGMLGERTSVICDVSVPMDTDPSVRTERPDVQVIQGGVVQLPANPDFGIGGIPLEPGLSFACMAETMLLGLEGIEGHYSYGPITAEQVERIVAVADRHGFTLGRARREHTY